MKNSPPITYQLYVVLLDGGVLHLNAGNSRTRRHMATVLMHYNDKSEVWSLDSNGFWYLDTMEECKSLLDTQDLPNWLKAYLLIHGD